MILSRSDNNKLVQADLDKPKKPECLTDIDENINILKETGSQEETVTMMLLLRNAIHRFVKNCMENEKLIEYTDSLISSMNQHDLSNVIHLVESNPKATETMIQLAGCFQTSAESVRFLRENRLDKNENILLMQNVLDLVKYCFPALDVQVNVPDIVYIPYQMYKETNLLPGCENELDSSVKAYYDKARTYTWEELARTSMYDLVSSYTKTKESEEDMER